MKTKMPRVFFTYYAMPGVSLFLKVEGALKKVGGRGNSADCYGGGRGQRWTFYHFSTRVLC